jgi:hypothetical protein
MATTTIPIGNRLNERTALQLAADLAQVDPAGGDDVLLDFRQTVHYEPFGMLFTGSAVRRLQHRASLVGGRVSVAPPSDAATGISGHMGFWQSVGVDVGRPVNSPAGRNSYLPITRIDVLDLYNAGGGTDPRGSGVVEAEAAKLARVLANPYSVTLLEALTYALRELIRNVLEHAMTQSLWLAGMSWPKRDFVQIAIVDEGRGVRQSLSDLAEFRYDTDMQAIREALKPGVTRNKGRTRSRDEVERWADERHVLPLSVFDNSGYGLHMVSSFCREAGQFLLASGSSYLAFVSSAEVPGSTLHKGTALRLVVEPTKVGPAFDQLFETLGFQGGGRRPMLSASTLRRLGIGTTVDEHDRQEDVEPSGAPSKTPSSSASDELIDW